MVKIRTNDIFITDNDKIIFGNDLDSELFWDSSIEDLRLTTTISGVVPTQSYHLTPRFYVDDQIGVASGSLQNQITLYSNHANLLGLDGDDHNLYVPTDGSRGFTSTVSGIDPTQPYHLVTRNYLDSGFQASASAESVLFGLQFHFAIEAAEQQTISTSYVQALSLTVSGTYGGGIEAGIYRIGWNFNWTQDKLNREFLARVQLDDTETLFEVVISPYVDVAYFASITGFFYSTIASGTHYIDLDFATSNISATSRIKNIRLEFWRAQ